MAISISAEEFKQIRQYIQDSCGIQVGDDKTYLVEGRLSSLAKQEGCSCFGDFFKKAKCDHSGALRDKIIDAMTTNETLWFRDSKPWTTLEEAILPPLIQELRAGKRSSVRVWSAASSTGQEAYSFMMLADKLIHGTNVSLEKFQVVGTDISSSALFMAISGRYSPMAMARGIPDEYKRKYFTEDRTNWVLSDTIRKRVSFRKMNLQDSFAAMGKFDIIFCRNVLIYFSREFKEELIQKFSRCLSPDGAFFIGSSESMLGLDTPYQRKEHKGSSYFVLK